MDRRYHIDIFWHDASNCWVAAFPDLRGLSALGDTPEEALAEARVALDLWLETMEEDGATIPPATYRPVKAA